MQPVVNLLTQTQEQALALTLLESWVLLVDHKDFALTADNLAILGATLDA